MRTHRVAIAIALSIAWTADAGAVTVASRVGTPHQGTTEDPAPAQPGTLTGGFVNDTSIIWTHGYTPIVGTINSARLEFDTIDGDTGSVTIRQTNGSGTVIGSFGGTTDVGGPGPWRGVDQTQDVKSSITIGSGFYAALASGSFTFFADTSALGTWGSNRALLTIDYTPSVANTIYSQVGTSALTGSAGSGTLTNGLVNDADQPFTFSYGAVPGAITSATLKIDLIDADNGSLILRAGTSGAGTQFGTATGTDRDAGAMVGGDWRALGDLDAIDNTIVIPSSLYADLADGTFQVYGQQVGMSTWGSNRALLTLQFTTAVPEPGILALAAGAGAVLLVRRTGARRQA